MRRATLRAVSMGVTSRDYAIAESRDSFTKKVTRDRGRIA